MVMLLCILKGLPEDRIRVESVGSLHLKNYIPFSGSILVKFSRLRNMTQGTVRSSYIRLLKRFSGFEQSSLMMQRQNLPGRKYVRTFFLVVNLCSLKAHWGVLSLATLLRSVMFV